MTTPVTAGPPPVSGLDIGLAARATRAILDRLLARSGTDFTGWVALRTLAQPGAVPGPDALRDDLATTIGIDTGSARLALDRLAAQGFTKTADTVSLTEAGAAFYRGLVDQIGQVTADLYGGIEASDLAATRRVLAEVTDRANARLAA
jgi:DNA-binding MarR family transcriptional regulator